MKTIFWNVDTQYDFMRDDAEHQGALPVPGAKSIEDNLAALTDYAHNNKITIVNTADWHNKDSEEFSETPNYTTTFPPHCLQRTKGADFVPATKPTNAYKIDWQQNLLYFNDVHKAVRTGKDLILYKDKFDIFAGNSYASDVVEKILQPETAIVYGVATNVCVNDAVHGLTTRGVQVVVPTDAIKELPGQDLETILDDWKSQGVTLTTTEAVLGGYYA